MEPEKRLQKPGCADASVPAAAAEAPSAHTDQQNKNKKNSFNI
jgi:hypothetical protein